MSPDRRILEVLLRITTISNNRKYDFQKKLNLILKEIVDCMQVSNGSIMLIKNRKTLEVVASTRPHIIGQEQSLDTDSPSTWVVNNKQPLYSDASAPHEVFIKRFSHYKSDAFFLAPLMNNDIVVGLVTLTDRIEKDVFIQEERELLMNIMGHVIIALENNRLATSLRKQHRSIKKKNQELRKLEKLRTDLFNMLVHDLKGPISVIIANLDVLTYTLEEEENIEFVETARSSCNTLYNMVSNLLDITRLEEGKLPLVLEEIKLQAIIKESQSALLVSLKTKDIRFTIDFPESDDVSLQVDRSMILRVLQNLLMNAIDYSPHGETLTLGYRHHDSGGIEFFVSDKGPGVPEHSRESIFDKYVQLDKKADGRVYTTGLGLAFCKMAVEAHGGQIGVESGEQEGSRFYFVLPRPKKA